MIVYGSTLSPLVRKTLAFAAEKAVPVELVPIAPGDDRADFHEASPFRRMPALRDPGADGGGDFTLADSSAICSYIEARHPQPPLIPAEPRARGKTIWYEEFADAMLVPVGGRMFWNRFVAPRVLKRAGDEAVAAKAETEELPPLLDYLESVVPGEGFLVGDALTLADLAVASPFATLHHLGWMIDPVHWPKTLAYVAAILARPSFAGMIARERRFVAEMGGPAPGGVPTGEAGLG